jgi:hypothetical protein
MRNPHERFPPSGGKMTGFVTQSLVGQPLKSARKRCPLDLYFILPTRTSSGISCPRFPLFLPDFD